MSTNNFTDIHIRDFIHEVRPDPTRLGYDSAIQLHALINVPEVQGEERSDDVDFAPIPALIRFFAPSSRIDSFKPGAFVYARGSFWIENTQDGPRMIVSGYDTDW